MRIVYQSAAFTCLAACAFLLPWWLAAVCFFAYALFFHPLPLLVLAVGIDVVFGIMSQPHYTFAALGAVAAAFLATRYLHLNIEW